MKKWLMFFILVIASMPGQTRADSEYGIGIILVSPTGVSFEKKLSADRTLDAAMGWHLGDYLYFHADMLFYKYGIYREKAVDLDMYYGIGGRFWVWDDHDNGKGRGHDDLTQVGVRVPIGLSTTFSEVPLQIFGELSAALDLIEETNFDLDLGLGVRYRF